MLRRLLILLLAVLPLAATTVTGTFAGPTGAVLVGNRVTFTLVAPPGLSFAKQISTARSIPTGLQLVTTLNGSGSIGSQTLIGNDDLSPSTTYYRIDVWAVNGGSKPLATQYMRVVGSSTNTGVYTSSNAPSDISIARWNPVGGHAYSLYNWAVPQLPHVAN